jgi:hypothetical protein
MDMEWAFRLSFLGLLGVGLVGMFVCRRWPIVAVLFLPLIAWGGLRQMTELNHLYANETINAEAGVNLRHIVVFYLAFAISAVLVVVGAFQGSRRRKLGVYSR